MQGEDIVRRLLMQQPAARARIVNSTIPLPHHDPSPGTTLALYTLWAAMRDYLAWDEATGTPSFQVPPFHNPEVEPLEHLFPYLVSPVRLFRFVWLLFALFDL